MSAKTVKLASITSLVSLLFDILLHEPEAIERSSIKFFGWFYGNNKRRVEEPDLDFIKKNSEKIVEKAFEKEKINWKGFIYDLRKPLMKLSFGS